MVKQTGLICVALATVLLSGCEENLEKADFNAFFYYPGSPMREEYLGQVHGLSACQSIARSKASALKMTSANWSYICCKKTSSSSCESKHR